MSSSVANNRPSHDNKGLTSSAHNRLGGNNARRRPIILHTQCQGVEAFFYSPVFVSLCPMI